MAKPSLSPRPASRNPYSGEGGRGIEGEGFLESLIRNQSHQCCVQHIDSFRLVRMKLSDDHVVTIAKALADKTRLRILSEIARGKSITCGEAEEIAGLSQPTVSHHLKVLFDAGLLITTKKGRHVNISVNKKAFDQFSEMIARSMKR